MFDLGQILAAELSPSIRVLVGPGDVIEVDQFAFEANREAILSLCLSIPNAELGLSWPLLMPWTGQNGQYAKLLIALGQILGVWQMHPSVDTPEMWNPRLHPAIMASNTPLHVSSRVPKPSRGDLEVRVLPCETCGCPSVEADAPEIPAGFTPCDLCGHRERGEEEDTSAASVNAYLRQFSG